MFSLRFYLLGFCHILGHQEWGERGEFLSSSSNVAVHSFHQACTLKDHWQVIHASYRCKMISFEMARAFLLALQSYYKVELTATLYSFQTLLAYSVDKNMAKDMSKHDNSEKHDIQVHVVLCECVWGL